MPIITHTKRNVLTGLNVASTGYVYNTNASSGAEDGWFNARYNNVVVQMGCATLTSKTVGFRVEGRFSDGRSASIYTTTVSVGNSIDKLKSVDEKMNEIRVGARLTSMVSTPLASPHNVYISIGFTDSR